MQKYSEDLSNNNLNVFVLKLSLFPTPITLEDLKCISYTLCEPLCLEKSYVKILEERMTNGRADHNFESAIPLKMSLILNKVIVNRPAGVGSEYKTRGSTKCFRK